MLFALLLAAGVYRYGQVHRETDIGHVDSIGIEQVVPSKNLLAVPDSLLPPNSALPGWVLHLGDKYRQSIEVCREDDGEILLRFLSSNPKAEFWLSSGSISVNDDMKFVVEGLFRKGDDFKGSAWMAVSLVKNTGAGDVAMEQYIVKEPALKRRGGWIMAKQTFNLPKGTHSIRVSIRGKFTGTVLVKNVILEYKSGG